MADKKKSASIYTRWEESPKQYKSSPNRKPSAAERKRAEEAIKKRKGK